MLLLGHFRPMKDLPEASRATRACAEEVGGAKAGAEAFNGAMRTLAYAINVPARLQYSLVSLEGVRARQLALSEPRGVCFELLMLALGGRYWVAADQVETDARSQIRNAKKKKMKGNGNKRLG